MNKHVSIFQSHLHWEFEKSTGRTQEYYLSHSCRMAAWGGDGCPGQDRLSLGEEKPVGIGREDDGGSWVADADLSQLQFQHLKR